MTIATLITAVFVSAVNLTVASQQVPAAPNGASPRSPSAPLGPQLGNADDCSAPELLTGSGPYNFDLTMATTGPQGQAGASCYFAGSTAIENDVWFLWTEDLNGIADFTTCTQTGTDTKIAIYDEFGCPVGPPVVCNDDDCGTQSRVEFIKQQATYLIQIGTSPGATAGTGTFTNGISQYLGSDDCSGADPIFGTGTYFYQIAGSTTGPEGQNEALCASVATAPGIENDKWFNWRAPADGVVRVKTCGNYSLDTKMAVYAGANCPTGPALACNDDACHAYRSKVFFAAVSGEVYAIQIGTPPGGSAIFGYFDVSIAPTGKGEDVCSDASPIFGQGTFEFDNSSATQGPLAQNDPGCDLFGSRNIAHDVWFEWSCYDYGLATISTCGGTTVDTKIAAWPDNPNGACFGPWGIYDCDDDNCGLQSSLTFAVEPGIYILQIGSSPGAPGGVGTFDIAVRPAIGTAYCSPAAVNSTGAPAVITASGSLHADANDLTLSATALPQNQFGYFLASRSQAFIANPAGSDGNLCLGQPFGRFSAQVANSGPLGSIAVPIDLTSIPNLGAVFQGSTWSFQCWYRDGAPGSNFSDGVEITFQ
jgi:hypothetical protein